MRSIFGIHDPTGLSYLTQIRVGLSKLSFHKFKHNFRDTVNSIFPTNDGIEDTEHFLLLCPALAVPRRDLLTGVFALLLKSQTGVIRLTICHTNLQKNVLQIIDSYWRDGETFMGRTMMSNIQMRGQELHKT